jgi:hypothetical protein
MINSVVSKVKDTPLFIDFQSQIGYETKVESVTEPDPQTLQWMKRNMQNFPHFF